MIRNIPDPIKFLFIILLVVAIYFPAMSSGFIWNDDTFLYQNSLIHRSDGLVRFWASTEAPDYFPLVSTSLWFEWRLWGLNATGYHITNIVLHLLSVYILWRLLLLLNFKGAWFAALIFAVHPVNVESVAWITERKNTLTMVFYLLSLLCFVKWDKRHDSKKYYWSLLFFVMALLCKTAVVGVPILLGFYFYFQNGNIKFKQILRLVPFFLVSLVFGLITVWFQHHRAIGEAIIRTDSLLTRALGAGWAFWFYLYKLAWPSNLIFIYPRWNIDSSRLISYIPILSMLIGGIFLWKKRHSWGRSVFYGLGYFLIMILPVLGFVNIYFMRFSFVADHWQYFAMIGAVVLVVYFIETIIMKYRESRVWVYGFMGLSVLVLSLLTFQQSQIYKSEKTLWADTIDKNPKSWMAYNSLGLVYLEEGNNQEAEKNYLQALRLKPEYPRALTNMGNLLMRKGDAERAVEYYQKVLELIPDHPETYVHLGNVMMQAGQYDQALQYYESAYQYQKNDANILTSLGNAWITLGEFQKGFDYYEKAILLEPNNALCHVNYGASLLRFGKSQEGVFHYLRAIEIRPSPGAFMGLATAMILEKDYPSAINYFRKTLGLDHAHFTARLGLADSLTLTEQFGDALEQYRYLINLNPAQPQVLNNLGNLYVRMGLFDAAIDQFENALEIDINYSKARQNLTATLKLRRDYQ